jgi:hypothetical protein
MSWERRDFIEWESRRITSLGFLHLLEIEVDQWKSRHGSREEWPSTEYRLSPTMPASGDVRHDLEF